MQATSCLASPTVGMTTRAATTSPWCVQGLPRRCARRRPAACLPAAVPPELVFPAPNSLPWPRHRWETTLHTATRSPACWGAARSARCGARQAAARHSCATARLPPCLLLGLLCFQACHCPPCATPRCCARWTTAPSAKWRSKLSATRSGACACVLCLRLQPLHAPASPPPAAAGSRSRQRWRPQSWRCCASRWVWAVAGRGGCGGVEGRPGRQAGGRRAAVSRRAVWHHPPACLPSPPHTCASYRTPMTQSTLCAPTTASSSGAGRCAGLPGCWLPAGHALLSCKPARCPPPRHACAAHTRRGHLCITFEVRGVGAVGVGWRKPDRCTGMPAHAHPA